MAGNLNSNAAPITSCLSKLQSLNGLFAIHKKKGPTSADVLNMLKKKLLQEAGVENPNPRKRQKQSLKMGHGGTLDSSASGVLVVGIGNGTKMLTSMLAGSKVRQPAVICKETIRPWLMVSGRITRGKKSQTKDKPRAAEKYVAVGELGKATDSFDATGSVTQEKDFKHITRSDLEEKLKDFTGEIMQVPPLYSALKKDGQRMSVMLLKGKKVEAKPARPVTVYNLTLRDFSPPHFTLDIECGGGFYVRRLVDDLGKVLSSCAYVKELSRTKQGQFTLEEHALHEEQWTLEHIIQTLQPCPETKPSGNWKKRPYKDLQDKKTPENNCKNTEQPENDCKNAEQPENDCKDAEQPENDCKNTEQPENNGKEPPEADCNKPPESGSAGTT